MGALPQAIGRFFQVKERSTTFTQELRGGLVTFLTGAREAWTATRASLQRGRATSTCTACRAAPPRPPYYRAALRPPHSLTHHTPTPPSWPPLTVAYILAVNSNIVTSTGGMCVVDGTCKTGVPPAFQSDECQSCITNLRASLISATAGG